MVELPFPRDAPAKAGSIVEDSNDMHDGGCEGSNMCPFWREIGDLMECRPWNRRVQGIAPTGGPRSSG